MTGTRYGLDILDMCRGRVNRVKTKSQKVLEANSLDFRSCRGKTGREGGGGLTLSLHPE